MDDEADLKSIHGDDVELAADDSEDENLTEKVAVAQAKREGIEFADTYRITRIGSSTYSDDIYETKAEADDALSKLNGDYQVIQVRAEKIGE